MRERGGSVPWIGGLRPAKAETGVLPDSAEAVAAISDDGAGATIIGLPDAVATITGPPGAGATISGPPGAAGGDARIPPAENRMRNDKVRSASARFI